MSAHGQTDPAASARVALIHRYWRRNRNLLMRQQPVVGDLLDLSVVRLEDEKHVVDRFAYRVVAGSSPFRVRGSQVRVVCEGVVVERVGRAR